LEAHRNVIKLIDSTTFSLLGTVLLIAFYLPNPDNFQVYFIISSIFFLLSLLVIDFSIHRIIMPRNRDIENASSFAYSNVERSGHCDEDDMNKLESERGISDTENISSDWNAMELKSHIPESQLIEGFRVRIDKLPERSVESNASKNSNKSSFVVAKSILWGSFQQVEHQLDSSSCHIYKANWTSMESEIGVKKHTSYTAENKQRPVILKLIKADRIHSTVALSEFEMEVSVLSR
jgi:hypothetical protein